jgi:hypothetical protein
MKVKGVFEYFVSDYLKTRIKHKNPGPVALSLLEREIVFFRQQGFDFLTVRRYCERSKLLAIAD